MFSSDKRQNNEMEINREKVCPFLLRVFYKDNEYNSLDDMNKGIFPIDKELHIYTWMDASLRELTTLIKETVDSTRKKDIILNFSFIFPDSKGKYQRKEIGYVFPHKKTQDETRTLQQLKFTIGDFLDINISNKIKDK